MNKIITTTTINPPTAAMREYDRMDGWELVVVGDERTPPYKLARGTYISWEEQQAKYPKLCALLGPGSVQRGRMIAFIEAWKRGAEVMASVDDDCYPLEGWGGALRIGDRERVTMHQVDEVAFDPYSALGKTVRHVRHRGYPRELAQTYDHDCEKWDVFLSPLVQENISVGDPDIDAIDRLSRRTKMTGIGPDPWCSHSFCPINTQNTFFAREAIPDFYGNIPGIGRMDDIWAGYLFQAMHPGTVIYASANNVQMQNRTLESMLNDLEQEMFGYRTTMHFLEALCKGVGNAMAWLPDIAKHAIDLYREEFV